MLPGERAGDTEKFNSTATGYATQFGVNKGEFKFHAGPDSGK